ncbi:MAG: DUF5615 family PIN-like protein [Nostoc sp.]|uniref:DUF5615 family PIN-like protein n=1 Tax=Nostoc sp. TaxID=1180 RepID=UPI002FFA8B83
MTKHQRIYICDTQRVRTTTSIPNQEVLAFAISQERSILTINRVDFIRLHRRSSNHFGITVCTNNSNWKQFAARIDEAVVPEESLQGKLIRVVRPVT